MPREKFEVYWAWILKIDDEGRNTYIFFVSLDENEFFMKKVTFWCYWKISFVSWRLYTCVLSFGKAYDRVGYCWNFYFHRTCFKLLVLLYQELLLTTVNPSKTSFCWVFGPCQQEKASLQWQIVLGLEAAVKHTYFLFHTFFMEICVDSLHKICFYFSGTAHNLCS